MNYHDINGPVSLNCSCNFPGHMLHFWYNSEYDELSVTVCMSPNAGIFRRIWTALKYVFGTKANLWEYSDTLLDRDKIDTLKIYLSACNKEK